MIGRSGAARSLSMVALLCTIGATSPIAAQQNLLHRRDIYLDTARDSGLENVWFPQSFGSGDAVYLFYQDVDFRPGDNNGFQVSLRILRANRWQEPVRIGQPVSFRREDPPLGYSSMVSASGDIAVAILESGELIRLFTSNDNGSSFRESHRITGEITNVAPRLFRRGDEGGILFVNQAVGDRQLLFYSISDDSENWSDLVALKDAPTIRFSFLPYYLSVDDREYVVFQILDPEFSGNYQLYTIYRDSGEEEWSDLNLVTDVRMPAEPGEAIDYDNQRPTLLEEDGRLLLIWERGMRITDRLLVAGNLDRDATLVDTPTVVAQLPGGAHDPYLFRLKGERALLWFGGNEFASDAYLSLQDQQGRWGSMRLNVPGRDASFPTVAIGEGRPYFFWTERRSQSVSRLVERTFDRSVAPPALFPVNFVAGRTSNRPLVRLRWEPPEDISGIASYIYVWSQIALPAPFYYSAELPSSRQTIDVEAEDEGLWYFYLIAIDRAGNRSNPTEIRYRLDTRAPPAVRFVQPDTDEEGFLLSNSFRLQWEEPRADDVAGYSLLFRLAGANSTPIERIALPSLSGNIVTTASFIERRNIDNGLWSLSVAPIDVIGNVGPTETIFLRLNRYIPTTEIHGVTASQDRYGQYTVDVVGRGFTIDGAIDGLILDRDASEPYDRIYEAERGRFRVVDDRRIAGPTIGTVETGEYRLGLRHPVRGIYFAPDRLAFEATGTVVFGDHTVFYAPDYTTGSRALFSIRGDALLFWIVICFLAVAATFSTVRVVSTAREVSALRINVGSLVGSRRTTRRVKEFTLRAMKKQGIGLHLKFTIFAMILVVSITLGISLILSNSALTRQESILVRGLQNRIEVLLTSVATLASSIFIDSENLPLDLELLSDQSEVMQEALYITITGQGEGGTNFDYVWASNDERLTDPPTDPPTDPSDNGVSPIARSLDTESLVPGLSRIVDPVTEPVAQLRNRLEQTASVRVGTIPPRINELTQRATRLILNEGRTEDDPEVARLGSAVVALRRQLEQGLSEIGKFDINNGFPQLNVDDLSSSETEYLFYQPVVAWRPGTGDDPETTTYYQGLIRLGISTEILLEELRVSRRELIVGTVVVALIALGAGLAGALFLATIIVIPINKLVRGVEIIQGVEDKSQLTDHVITVKSRDELSVLAETINSMTRGLVQAAAANKDLTIGKEVQKLFIPLSIEKDGNKKTTALDDLVSMEFAGYYEGAKGVSGDYFSYLRLDGEHYAVIKCDVAGKGVSAALIMVEVATIFTDHFGSWSLKSDGLELSELVRRINDLLESMNFQGRFAAFTVGILNIRTGQTRICNAGDTQLHVYRSASQSVELLRLEEAPAAGVFSSSILPTGFPEAEIVLQTNDILLLFTDGVEESRRMLRNRDMSPHIVTEQDIADGLVPTSMTKESTDEEFGISRIHAVIEAIMRRGVYRLEKILNSISDERLEFDFRHCDPTAESVVIGLIAVEKIFRLYTPLETGIEDRVTIDKTVDEFLHRYFRQFGSYFNAPAPVQPNQSYTNYLRIKEDEQFDDLTVLAIRKK